jgi:hypothetical protein
MTLQDAQDALVKLFMGGAFNFSDNLSTITAEERQKLLDSMDPTPYELAYQLGPINYIEKLHIDYNGSIVDMIRTETTWEYNKTRAFQLVITTVPPSILILDKEPEGPKILDTIWWCNSAGTVIAYESRYNDKMMERIGFD